MVILLGGPYEGFITTTDSFEQFERRIPDPVVVWHLPGIISINAVYRER
ncbi:MAG: hypothetical protein ABSE93_07600 [Terriglobia bacterium]|jgi:hypothetical protein